MASGFISDFQPLWSLDRRSRTAPLDDRWYLLPNRVNLHRSTQYLYHTIPNLQIS